MASRGRGAGTPSLPSRRRTSTGTSSTSSPSPTARSSWTSTTRRAPSRRLPRRSTSHSNARIEPRRSAARVTYGRWRRSESRSPSSTCAARSCSSRPAAANARSRSTASGRSGPSLSSSSLARAWDANTSYAHAAWSAESGRSRPARCERAPKPSRYPRSVSQLGAFEKALRFGEGRRLKRLAEQAAYIGSLEPEFEQLSDEELAGKTVEFRERVENGEPVDELVFEAFAAVREAFRRTMGVSLFEVQRMGGIVLHEGDIAEMRTGEGKTFVAVQPLYLNALTGRNVHLVTVNDYLAKRDAEWTKPVWDALGMRASFIQTQMSFEERKEAYAADVTYGTNSEFGFDYLRDNMAVTLEGVVQRGHSYAIVDEVDSILIDEARTPLIISGEPETAAQVYYDFARVVKALEGHASKVGEEKNAAEASGADFAYDEKHKTVSPLHDAIEKVERALGVDNLYDPRNAQLVNHLNQGLKAQSLYQRDVDYVVQDGEVKIVDEFTGRIMEGRRWSEGLHQAVEAKEGVRIQEEFVTVATITLQNYFRLYEKLGGMTGTAKTEEKEFTEIYNLRVVEIPTNVKVARIDNNDYIFKTKEAKWNALLTDITERYE